MRVHYCSLVSSRVGDRQFHVHSLSEKSFLRSTVVHTITGIRRRFFSDKRAIDTLHRFVVNYSRFYIPCLKLWRSIPSTLAKSCIPNPTPILAASKPTRSNLTKSPLLLASSTLFRSLSSPGSFGRNSASSSLRSY
jgi:hypothetical protein